jgi:hypothetical protein
MGQSDRTAVSRKVIKKAAVASVDHSRRSPVLPHRASSISAPRCARRLVAGRFRSRSAPRWMDRLAIAGDGDPAHGPSARPLLALSGHFAGADGCLLMTQSGVSLVLRNDRAARFVVWARRDTQVIPDIHIHVEMPKQQFVAVLSSFSSVSCSCRSPICLSHPTTALP